MLPCLMPRLANLGSTHLGSTHVPVACTVMHCYVSYKCVHM